MVYNFSEGFWVAPQKMETIMPEMFSIKVVRSRDARRRWSSQVSFGLIPFLLIDCIHSANFCFEFGSEGSSILIQRVTGLNVESTKRAMWWRLLLQVRMKCSSSLANLLVLGDANGHQLAPWCSHSNRKTGIAKGIWWVFLLKIFCLENSKEAVLSTNADEEFQTHGIPLKIHCSAYFVEVPFFNCLFLTPQVTVDICWFPSGQDFYSPIDIKADSIHTMPIRNSLICQVSEYISVQGNIYLVLYIHLQHTAVLSSLLQHKVRNLLFP